jgi:hypothetical protein
MGRRAAAWLVLATVVWRIVGVVVAVEYTTPVQGAPVESGVSTRFYR